MRISGAPDYAAGEELIVFLYRTPIGYLRATGYGQGKYTVTAQRRMRASLNGFELWKRDSHGVALSTLDGLTVTKFKARVRGAMGSRR
jgi:hypothetical protein